MKGLFITIEGNDGSGKSTVINSLKEALSKLDIDVIYSREPGGSPIAEKIRDVILDVENVKMDKRKVKANIDNMATFNLLEWCKYQKYMDKK